MAKSVSRRRFLAAVLAGNAMAVYGQRRPPPRGAPMRQAAPVQVAADPQLWLPTSSGQAANVEFANSPDWVRRIASRMPLRAVG